MRTILLSTPVSPQKKRAPMPPRMTPPLDLSPYAGFIFDCDGTIADTMPAHFQAWRQALSEGGADFDFTWDVFVSRAGMGMLETIEELAVQYKVSLDAQLVIRRQSEIYRSLEHHVTPIDEVMAFARQVVKERPVAVASGNSRENVLSSLKQIGAADIFSIIITPEDVERGKPFPDMFLLAAQRMGVPPAACLVFEDGALGWQAAKRAGMDYVVVEADSGVKQEALTSQPSM